MQIKYKDVSIKKLCTSEKEAKKFFDEIRYYDKLQSVLNYISQSSSLADIASFPPFHFHPSDFYQKNSWALDIAGRKCKYRLIIIPLDDNGNAVKKDEEFSKKCKQITIVEIEEVSKHYE